MVSLDVEKITIPYKVWTTQIVQIMSYCITIYTNHSTFL